VSLQKIKGTQDFYGDKAVKMHYVEKIMMELAINSGFSEIRVPTFEATEVFVRSAGDESDIVSKEMYTFTDKGKRSITLRPEGTAGVARSFVENKMYANNLALTKLFYIGPMFRYERPQAGRYREFNQFGVEVFGDGTALLDADVIISAYNIFKKLGVSNLKLKINSIGDFESRKAYAEVLKEYFKNNIETMCGDCHRRLNTNPMRILDCKVDKDNPALLNAPKIKDNLNEHSLLYFQEVLNVLNKFNIPYEVDENLVRGLDYYTDTVFEYIIESDDELNGLAICAGGKYADLVKSFSGMEIPGIGYASGVERIVSVMEKQGLFEGLNQDIDVVVIALDSESKLLSLKIANDLRLDNISCDLDYKNIGMKQQFKFSDRVNAKFIIIIGENERNNNVVQVKDVKNKEQIEVSINDLNKFLKGKLS
jgi:histidyl-tRNA synthetase